MVEYLIIVAIMGVATIGILRIFNQTVNSKFASVVYAIQGKQKKATTETVDESLYEKRDLGDFMNGAASQRGSRD